MILKFLEEKLKRMKLVCEHFLEENGDSSEIGLEFVKLNTNEKHCKNLEKSMKRGCAKWFERE